MIPNCFREIELDISPGTFAGAVFDPGWNVTGAGTSHVQLTPLSGGFIPVGFLAPFTFCDPGGSGTHVLNVNILSGLPPTVDTCDFVFEYECFESTVDSCCLDFENFSRLLKTP